MVVATTRPLDGGDKAMGVEPAIVMAGFIPDIHVFTALIKKDVDAQDKPGHDQSHDHQCSG